METIHQVSYFLLELSLKCGQHLNKNILLYCNQHAEIICDSCQLKRHQMCKPISLEEAARCVKDGTAMSSLEQRMNDLSKVSKEMLNQIEEKLEDLKKRQNIFKQRVSDTKQKLIGHLNKLESEIHTDIDSKYEQCNATVSKIKHSLEECTSSLSVWKVDLKSLKDTTSEIHLFQTVNLLEERTNKKDSEIRKIQIADIPTFTYKPSELESNMEELLADLGTTKVEEFPVPMSKLNRDQGGQNTVGNQGKLLLTHSFQTKKLGNDVIISGACFISDDRLLLGHHNDTKLSVCKLDGSDFSTINLDYKPERITLYDDNYALVSAGHKGVQIIDLTSLKPDKKIKVKGNCTAITSSKNQIYIKNQRKTLTKIDIKGKILKTIHTAFDPWDICANNEGSVYYTHVGDNRVNVVTQDDKQNEIYTSPDLKGAEGVTVDDRGYVFIAGNSSNNIHRITYADKQPLSIAMTVDDVIHQPIGLSFNNETKRLLVVHDNYQSISIYKPQ
ncbi:unnamed protein product [Mytilus coruscus]|uniref:B box-type domain-containing protein n=1 Tax=Mytilus coruscus TaxID=42192 RepID=A0A6J7ZXA8_MYTCO|nr:unnamed protein product [Mytilus coruscus]